MTDGDTVTAVPSTTTTPARSENRSVLTVYCDACGEKVNPEFYTAGTGRRLRWKCKCGASGREKV